LRPARVGLGRARAIAIDISPLRDSVPFRALWLGQVVSLIGTHMRTVAVAFQIFALTKSTAAVGLVGLAEVVPLILVSIVGGPLVDTFDRRKIMAGAQLLLIADSVALAALSLWGSPVPGALYALVAVGSAVTAIDGPARSSAIPTLVPPRQLPAALALRQVLYQTTHIAGPALGGLLLGVLANVGWIYLLDAMTFLAAFIALRWMPALRPGEPLEREQSPTAQQLGLAAIREGLTYARRTPVLMSIFIIDLVAMIFGMPRAVFPALADGTFAVGPFGLGLLYAAPSTGALIGALTTGWVSHVRRRGVAVLISVAVWGAAITVAGFSLHSFILTLFWLGIAGAADVISAVFRGTILLEVTPDSLLGRMNALNLMVVTGGPRLGDVEAGFVAHAVGAGPSVVVGGVACLAGTVIVGSRFRSLRDYVPPEAPKERTPEP
jgi:MFS family permease